MPDVEEYIRRKGWDIQTTERGGREIVLKVCPVCDKESKNRADRNFYINADSGVWVTNCCQQKGNLITLKRQQGDLDFMASATPDMMFASKRAQRLAGQLRSDFDWGRPELPPQASHVRYQARLWSGDVPTALEYLQDVRGLTEETLKHFGVGVARRGKCKACDSMTSLGDGDVCPGCAQPVGRAWDMISIPYLRDGRAVNFKFRSFAGEKRFEGWTDAPAELYNRDSLDGSSTRVVVAEAEFDAMSFHQLGYEQVVSLGGAGKELKDEWAEDLVRFDEVLVAYDNDKAGDDGAEDKLIPKIGRYRCRRVRLPLKDCNECLASGMDPDDIRLAIESAVGYRMDAVRHISSYEDDLVEDLVRKRYFGSQTSWPGLNYLLGGFRDAELTVVTGNTGSGKSTWTEAAALDQARGDVLGNRPAKGVFIASFELEPKAVVKKAVVTETGKAFRDCKEQDIRDAFAILKDRKIFVLDHYGRIPMADLRDAIEYGVRRHGLWMVVLDHLHFLLNTTPERERHDITDAMEEMKLWTRNFGIHILLVVHPGKPRYVRGRLQKVELNDLRGAAALEQTADNVIRVWKPSIDEVREGVPDYSEIATLKVRSEEGTQGTILLAFDRGSQSYKYDPDLADKIKKKKGGRKSSNGFDSAAAAAGELVGLDDDDPFEQDMLF